MVEGADDMILQEGVGSLWCSGRLVAWQHFGETLVVMATLARCSREERLK